jgi:hypothetical protein
MYQMQLKYVPYSYGPGTTVVCFRIFFKIKNFFVTNRVLRVISDGKLENYILFSIRSIVIQENVNFLKTILDVK